LFFLFSNNTLSWSTLFAWCRLIYPKPKTSNGRSLRKIFEVVQRCFVGFLFRIQTTFYFVILQSFWFLCASLPIVWTRLNYRQTLSCSIEYKRANFLWISASASMSVFRLQTLQCHAIFVLFLQCSSTVVCLV
jgi:hypothetical protein